MRSARLIPFALLAMACTTIAPGATAPTISTGPAAASALPTPMVIYVTPSPPSPTPTAAATPTPRLATPASAQPTPAGGLAQGCLDVVMPLYHLEDDLDTRLSLGLNFGDYSSKVSDIVVAAKPVTAAALEPYGADCAKLGIYVLGAELDYIDAYDAWNKCIGKLSCSNSDVEPKLQDFWSKATDQLNQAKAQLGLS